MAELFSRIWNKRIEGFVVENILGEFQGGFRKGRNTMDKAFIITTPLGRARKRGNSSLFMAFIDLRKAFDKYMEKKTMGSPKREEAGRKNINIVNNSMLAVKYSV